MKKSRYSVEQVAFALRQVESGTLVPEVCRKMGIVPQVTNRHLVQQVDSPHPVIPYLHCSKAFAVFWLIRKSHT